jgi:hypothetical protein
MAMARPRDDAPKYPLWGDPEKNPSDASDTSYISWDWELSPQLIPLAPGFVYFNRRVPPPTVESKFAKSFVKKDTNRGKSSSVSDTAIIDLESTNAYRQYHKSLQPQIYDGESLEALIKFLEQCEETWPKLMMCTRDVRMHCGELVDASDQIVWAARFLRGRPYKCFRETYPCGDNLNGGVDECNWAFFKSMLENDLKAHEAAMQKYRTREQSLSAARGKDGTSSNEEKDMHEFAHQVGLKGWATIRLSGKVEVLKKWLVVEQKEGQRVREYSEELRLLESRIGGENLGYEMIRDRFVMGLRGKLRERVLKYVRQEEHVKLGRHGIEVAAIVEEGLLPRAHAPPPPKTDDDEDVMDTDPETADLAIRPQKADGEVDITH